jgi:hypothetical protein
MSDNKYQPAVDTLAILTNKVKASRPTLLVSAGPKGGRDGATGPRRSREDFDEVGIVEVEKEVFSQRKCS